MEELQVTGTYKEFKTTLDTELSKAAEGFVKIGYLLRIAKDTDILRESGYATVADFAKAEYGLTKDIVSRYMAINERFSEGGYSDKLKEEYKGYGVAKLAEMLTLPDAVVESMSPLMTKADIQEVKKEIKSEEQITDIEVMLEEKKEFQTNLNSTLNIALSQYYYELKEQYCTIWNTFSKQSRDRGKDIDAILNVMAPSGIKMMGTRPAGMGSVMISIRGKDMGIDVIVAREQRTEHYSWSDMIEGIENLCKDMETPQQSWEEVFGEKFEVAPVQQEKQEDKEETKEVKEESKVNEEPRETVSTEIVQKEQQGKDEDNKQLEEEQIPGQANIEDFKEVLPDVMNPPEKEDKQVVIVEEKPRVKRGCALCRGEETLASHDGVFTLKITDKGYILVKIDNGDVKESAIFEFKYCPNCGEEIQRD